MKPEDLEIATSTDIARAKILGIVKEIEDMRMDGFEPAIILVSNPLSYMIRSYYKIDGELDVLCGVNVEVVDEFKGLHYKVVSTEPVIRCM